jgi:hypothetical protein
MKDEGWIEDGKEVKEVGRVNIGPQQLRNCTGSISKDLVPAKPDRKIR